jgi:hypothetical protein
VAWYAKYGFIPLAGDGEDQPNTANVLGHPDSQGGFEGLSEPMGFT